MERLLEIIGNGFEVMILGMGTVFVTLFGLIFVVEAIYRVTNRKARTSKGLPNKVSVVVPLETTNMLPEGEEENMEELIAVITAAVAASLNRSTHTLVVRSIRSASATSPAWNKVGRQEQIASRF